MLHRAIRTDDLESVKSILSQSDGARLARAKNYYGIVFYASDTDQTCLMKSIIWSVCI